MAVGINCKGQDTLIQETLVLGVKVFLHLSRISAEKKA